MYISLRCRNCDNPDCNLFPLGTFIDDESKQGCTRQVSENLCAKYEHIINEELPFAALGQYMNFDESDKVLDKIYNHCKIGTVLDNKGKSIKIKKKLIDSFNEDVVQ